MIQVCKEHDPDAPAVDAPAAPWHVNAHRPTSEAVAD
jgi:hypothetical protein